MAFIIGPLNWIQLLTIETLYLIKIDNYKTYNLHNKIIMLKTKTKALWCTSYSISWNICFCLSHF